MDRAKQQRHQMALDRARGTPLVTEMLEYLTLRGAIPKFADSASADGSFTYGVGYPPEGIIAHSPGRPSNIPHELVHAVQRQANAQGVKRYTYAEEFTSKLVGGYDSAARKMQPGPRAVAQAMNPEWTAANSDYRATNAEIPAWGVGNDAVDSRTHSVPHLDATMKTELGILIDLLMRDLKGNNK